MDIMVRSGRYELRQGQLDMSLGISNAIDVSTASGGMETLFVEAPTGTGKSIAILLNAFAVWKKLKKRSVVSTQTHVLQNQMMTKDYPALLRFLFSEGEASGGRMKWNATVAKGRSSYICLMKYRSLLELGNESDILVSTPSGASGIIDRSRLKSLSVIRRMSTEETAFPENDPILLYVSSDRRYCLGQSCPERRNCLYLRSIGMSAPLIITNHALLSGIIGQRKDQDENDGSTDDIAVITNSKHLTKKDGTPKKEKKQDPGIISADVYFFDEAHHLMGYRTEGNTLINIRKDEIDRLRLCPTPLSEVDAFASSIGTRKDFVDWFAKMSEMMASGKATVEDFAVSTASSMVILDRWSKRITSGSGSRATKTAEREDYRMARSIVDTVEDFGKRYFDMSERDKVFFDCSSGLRALTGNERSFATDLKRSAKNAMTAVFSSGTMFTGNASDNVFRVETGIEPTVPSIVVESPFDFSRMMIWLPPCPVKTPREHANSESEYARHIIRFCARYIPPYVKSNLGGVLVLCTSLRRMRSIHSVLSAKMDGKCVLMQGMNSKRIVANSFLSNESSVLVASSSFREGFDAPGKKLTWVILDRLPFASFDDKATRRRLDALKKLGAIESPFIHSLDIMKFALVQSVGRLIRSSNDWGAVTILDPRMRLRGQEWGLDECIPVNRSDWYMDAPDEDEWVERAREIGSLELEREEMEMNACF